MNGTIEIRTTSGRLRAPVFERSKSGMLAVVYVEADWTVTHAEWGMRLGFYPDRSNAVDALRELDDVLPWKDASIATVAAYKDELLAIVRKHAGHP